MRNGIPQQMFKGRHDAIQHAAIDLNLRPMDMQSHLFAQQLCGLSDHAFQSFGNARERHR